MTAAGTRAGSAVLRAGHPLVLPGRLLRLELRRNAMLWMVPLAAALFWFDAYRNSMAMPPLWNVRAMTMQHGAFLDFVAPVVGAAAWTGSRDGRRRVTDLVGVTARPRWARQLAAWAGTTCWAMAAYLVCVGVLYAVIALHASSGGPLWWPAAVGAAGIPALSAVGFAAGALVPSRFTTPLIAIAAFLALGFSEPLAHGGRSYGQISPIVAGAVDVGPNAGVGTFYHYLPDLSIAQMMLLAGIALAALGLLGLPARSGGRRLRRTAAAVTAAGLLTAGTALALVGTARLDPHGMMIIPALHDAASDRPIRYTPVCSRTAIPVCLNPAYAAYLPLVTAALQPVLSEVAGLPGAPGRVSQTAATYRQGPDNGISLSPSGLLTLPDPLPGRQQQPVMTTAEFAAQVRSTTGLAIVDRVTEPIGVAGRVGARPGLPPGIPALQAVRAALLKDGDVQLSDTGPSVPDQLIHAASPVPPGIPARGTPVYAAAQRFAAVPAAARHAWLLTHLSALRAGRITLAQLP